VRHRDTRVPGPRDAPPGAEQASMPLRRRATGDLGGERSPWKDRSFSDRQRSGNVTDSSAEQSPGVGHSSGGREVGDGLTSLRSRSWEAIREGRRTRVQRRSHPTQVEGDGSSGDGSAFLLNGTPGRSGLRSRDTTPIRRNQATSDRDLGAKGFRVYPEQPPRWPESRGKALVTWLRPGPGVVVVTWGSTPVDRSITTMDRALRSTRRHRARCHPPPGGSGRREPGHCGGSGSCGLSLAGVAKPEFSGTKVEGSRRR